MIESVRDHIKGVIKKGIVIGSDESCEYYPCHFEGQDCTWCFCPFYPCLDDRTRGKFVKSERTGKRVWSCVDCGWIHKNAIPEKILEKIKSLEKLNEEEFKRIRLKLLRR